MIPLNPWRKLELEWKILLLAAILFVAVAWPVQQYFITRLSESLEQSIDPQLEITLRRELSESSGSQRDAIREHIERYRQTRVLIPIIVREQQRLLLALTIGLFVLVLLLAFWILNWLTRPLKNLAGTVDKIGKGEVVTVNHVSGGALGIVEEAVEHLQKELVILREKARVQGMEAAWKDIARVMAHEIKNPLTPIRLTLDRIEEKTAGGIELSTEELTRFLTRINTQVDMLERLVDQFRSFSREPEVNLSTVDLAAHMRATADTMADNIRSTISGSATVQSDPYLLQQLFLNIWKNALEAGATNVTAEIRSNEREITISIRDNGAGIPKKDLSRIWLPYVTMKKNGTGLGLPVVKRLVETLKGSIDLTSIEGNGVTVHITLPKDNNRENSDE